MRITKLLFPLLILFISSCAGLKFNQQAQAQNQKVKALTEQVIDQSTQTYSPTTTATLADAYKSAIVFEQQRGKTNYPTVSMWKQVDGWINTDFVGTWKQQGTIGKPAAIEIKKRADILFDHIISLEDHKIK